MCSPSWTLKPAYGERFRTTLNFAADFIIADFIIYNQNLGGKITVTEKIITLTYRIEPNIKETLCTAAYRDHRSIGNMVVVMIRDYCGRGG